MMKFSMVVGETLRGKSLGRTLQNLAFANVRLAGRGIDLGAKSDKSSYYRFLQIEPGASVTFTDLRPQSPDVMRINLESEPIPVQEGSQDFLILANVLEHIYDYRYCVRESMRVLRPGGRLVGSVPFLVQVHPDPDDFFRYTRSSLHRIFEEAGFSSIEITPLAYGPFTAAASFVAPILKLKPLVAMSYLLAIGFDRLVTSLFGNLQRTTRNYFPLHYFFVCRK